ncbi:MAG TPA: hypothetical protein VGM90_00165 [Kofleriaceae bacterium]|jgi:hypothetical protein
MLRRTICAAVLVASATAAYADKKLQDLTPGLTKEAAACAVELRGLTKVLTGTTDLAATLTGADKEDIDKDLATLNGANTQVTGWCTELDGIVAFLTTNADAPYKSVSKELDERYRKVANFRKAAKKALTDIEPVTRKLIPRLKKTTTAAPDEKPTATVFPSKRAVVLPRLTGQWSVSGSTTSDTATYTDKTNTASATSRAFDTGSCEKERAALADKTDDAIADLEPPATAKNLGVSWSVRLTTRSPGGAPAHSLLVMCVGKKTGGVVVTGDILPATNKVLAAEITKLMVDMLAVQLAPKQ